MNIKSPKGQGALILFYSNKYLTFADNPQIAIISQLIIDRFSCSTIILLRLIT